MNNIATAMQTAQSPAVMLSMMQGGAGGLFGQGAMGGDFFTMMLQQIAGMTTPDAMAMFAQVQEPEQEGEQKETGDPWMQMLAGMMAVDGINEQMMIQMLMQQPTTQAEQLVQTLTGANSEQAAELLTMLEGKSGRQPVPVQPVQDGEQEAEVLAVPRGAGSAQAATVISQDSIKQAGSKQTDALFWGGQFKNAVSQAQKLIQSEPKQPEKEINVDAMQGDVSQGRYVPAAMTTDKALPLPEPKEIAEQVRTGIVSNLSNLRGKNEFVVKLKPEGLGEVVVHLTENAGRMTLSIITSSEQTARLLNGELAGLRETLKPFNTDVREVTSQQQQQNAQSSYDQSQYNQQSAHSGQQQQQGRRTQQDFSSVLYGEAEEEVPAAAVRAGVYI